MAFHVNRHCQGAPPEGFQSPQCCPLCLSTPELGYSNMLRSAQAELLIN